MEKPSDSTGARFSTRRLLPDLLPGPSRLRDCSAQRRRRKMNCAL
jgi:hypothetical protein